MTSFPTTIAGLTNGQQATYRRLLRRLLAKRARNRTRTRYYEGKNELKDLGYALPPIAKDIEMVVGWPAKAVEALANRVVLDGVTTRDGSELSRTVSDLMDANDLAQTAENAHTDALVHSCSFVAAFRGDTTMGEPEAIIQEFPADCATGSWDPRMHALGEALLFDVSHDDGRNGKVRCGYLMSDGMIVTFAGDGTRFSKQTEAPYDGRIPCELLAYRPDSKRPFGRSRINRTVMSLTDSAVRTFLRSELQAELYSVPPRYFLGVTEDMFTDEDGESIPMWRIALDKVLAIPRDETTGSVPEVGQFQQYSFEPHVTQLRNTATMFAAATSLPPDAMGVLTSNPSSAEAIDKAVKEVPRRGIMPTPLRPRMGTDHRPRPEIRRERRHGHGEGQRPMAQPSHPVARRRRRGRETRTGGHPARRQRSHLGHARSVRPATPDVAPRSPESTRPSANRPVEDPNRTNRGGEGWNRTT